METQEFHDEDGNLIRNPRKKDMRLGDDGEILPKRDHNGREIISYGIGNKPIVKVKFRKSMEVLEEISYMLEVVDRGG